MKEEKIIQRKIITKKCLSEYEQFMIFDFEDPILWLRKYIQNYKLASSAVEKKMVQLHDILLLSSYWQRYSVKSETLSFLFELGDLVLLKHCLKYNILEQKFQMKLVEFNNDELLKVYLTHWYLEEDAVIELLRSCSRTTLKRYLRHHNLSNKEEVALVERNDEGILSYYVSKHQLCDEAREKMYALANIAVIEAHSYSWVYPKAWKK